MFRVILKALLKELPFFLLFKSVGRKFGPTIFDLDYMASEKVHPWHCFCISISLFGGSVL